MAQAVATNEKVECFWSVPLGKLAERLDTNLEGLTTAEAKRRARVYGPNRLRISKRSGALTLLIAQFKSPLILILLAAAAHQPRVFPARIPVRYSTERLR